MRMWFPLAVISAALLGGVGLVALLPWGDPCFLANPLGEAGCPILLSPWQHHVRNAVFLLLCFLVGSAAGFVSPTRRYLAGALSAPFAVLFALLGSHFVYSLHSPLFRMDIPGSYTLALETVAVLVVVGILGAALPGVVRLTIVGGGREAR
jgi:hypothetical protein